MRRHTRQIKNDLQVCETSDDEEQCSLSSSTSPTSTIGSRFDLRNPVEACDVTFQTVETVIKSWEFDLKTAVPAWKEVGGELLLRR